MTPLGEVARYGQSIWLDYLDRGLILSGRLRQMIEQGITGITTNPTILERAISVGEDYDRSIRGLIERGEREPEKLYREIVFEDIRMAADLLRHCFSRSNGRDGFVSIEVSPHFAYEEEATVIEAKRIFEEIGRPNILIKVPATQPGIRAIERLIYEGINVNATLIFSQRHYQGAAQAYLSGLERRIYEGKSANVVSVASFFVSRIDTAVDRMLENLPHLKGRTAIACAKMLYQLFKQLFSSPRFLSLKERGAFEQRIVWASTSTKNPLYSDVLYVEELIGPYTINTIPETTLNAFKDHGKARPSLEEDIEGQKRILEEIGRAGIDLEQIGEELQREGVRLFARSYDQLLEVIKRKANSL